MKYVVWGLIVFLIIAHQDNWYWEDSTLVFGFFPISLLYHAGISMAAAVTWFLATKFAWPANLEFDSESSSGTGHESGAAPEEARP